MKMLRKLSRHGNANHFSVPLRYTDWLGWRVGESFILEVTLDRTIVIRRVTPADVSADSTSYELDRRAPGANAR